jgi:hypothetical protein
MEIKFTHNGVAKIRVGSKLIVLDHAYTTSDEKEISKLRSLGFREETNDINSGKSRNISSGTTTTSKSNRKKSD